MDLNSVKNDNMMWNTSYKYTNDSYKVFKCFKQNHKHTSVLSTYAIYTNLQDYESFSDISNSSTEQNECAFKNPFSVILKCVFSLVRLLRWQV
jgi:hypothetical protein